jgi:hypothetical protein
MKPAAVRLSPIVPAAFAAAIGMSLSVFLLPGAAVRSEPTPLLAASGAAGRVVVELPAPAKARASAPVRHPGSLAQLATPPTEQLVSQPQQAAPAGHPAHRQAPARVVGGAPAPVRVAPAPPPPPATPVKVIAGAPAPPAHGQGKAVGHLSDHHHNQVPPGQAKKAPTAPPAGRGAPAAPKGNGGGNGHKGGKK